MFKGKKEIEKILTALSEHLSEQGSPAIELLVCGGTALNVLGYVIRTTKDIDIIAYVNKDEKGQLKLNKAVPLNASLISAAEKVQKDFNLSDNWLNSGPASVMDLRLPDGLMKRVKAHEYGNNLIIHFLDRYDQIHFKLYAAVDQGGKHYDDLIQLNPTAEELEKAAKWSMIHDVSDTYKNLFKDLLIKMDYKNVAEKL